MKGFMGCLVLLQTLLFGVFALAGDEVLTLESTITGSQEQPKVIYIVPWQAPLPASGLNESNIAGIIQNEALGSVDREVFQRQIKYYDLLESQLIEK